MVLFSSNGFNENVIWDISKAELESFESVKITAYFDESYLLCNRSQTELKWHRKKFRPSFSSCCVKCFLSCIYNFVYRRFLRVALDLSLTTIYSVGLPSFSRFPYHCAKCNFDICNNCFKGYHSPISILPLVYGKLNGNDRWPYYCQKCKYYFCNACNEVLSLSLFIA